MRKAKAPGESPPALGSARAVRELLAGFNTSGDGGPGRSGTEVLHGPGMVVELPSGLETINQALATVYDEDIALPVLMKLCREQALTMVDIESGRTFG